MVHKVLDLTRQDGELLTENYNIKYEFGRVTGSHEASLPKKVTKRFSSNEYPASL